MAACSVGSSPVGSSAHALRRRALGVALALACIAAPVGATGSGATTRHAGESRMSPTAGLDTAACNADAFATTLQAAPDAPTDASDYWLDRGLLQWPAVEDDDTGTYRLYHSATGGITAGPGAAVTGADASDDFARQLVALVCSLRGSVCLYQGEELGLPEADVPYDKLRDPYGIAFWPNFKGRDGCRTPMPWTGAADAGFSPAEP